MGTQHLIRIMKNNVLFALHLLFCTIAVAQEAPRVILIDSVEVSGTLLKADRLNQLYLLTEEDQLWKTDIEGQPLFQFSDNTLGPVTEIDVFDPFNVLAFFREFQLAQVLDRTLNPNISFDFASLNLFNVQTIAAGVDNTVWLYDRQEGKILQLDEQGRVLNQSQDLVFLVGQRPDSTRLVFNKNELWLVAEGIGLLHFNAFGQYQKHYVWKEKIDQVQIWKEQLLFRSAKKWYAFNKLLWEVSLLPFPVVQEKEARIHFSNDYIFIQKKNTIYIHQLR